MYDEDGGQWHEMPSSGSGGGSSDEQLIQVMNKTITSFEAPKGAIVIPVYFFYGCHSLTNVSFSNTIKTIGESAFQGCTSLASIDIPGNVETLESSAFSGCTKLSNVTLHNGLTKIDYSCFQSCPIDSITIPETVTYLGSGISSKFKYVTMLSKIPPQIQASTFYKNNINTIYVPAESVDTYKTTTNWTNYASKIQPISE